MSDIENRLPGIVFHLADSGYRHGAGVVLGKVTVTCEVPDEETWAAVVALFSSKEGYRMLSGELQEEYMLMMRGETGKLHGRIKELEDLLRARTKELEEKLREQENKHTADLMELRKYKTLIGEFGSKIQGR